MDNKFDIRLLKTALQVEDCIAFVSAEGVGAIDVFLGTVRNNTSGRKVLSLEFEAYKPMAVSELQKIALKIMEKWPAEKIAIHHRVGRLEIGELAVVIAVSTPHRLAAFQACQFAIDTLKETVPIWKKEIFEDGESWVAAHP